MWDTSDYIAFIFHYRYNTINDTILPTVSQPGFFNFTSTFRNDSDLPIPYLKTVKKKQQSLPTKEQILDRKRKLMSWIVSHCKTRSKREKYIEKLIKFIPVDIFGACGTDFPCKKGSYQCEHNFLAKYKCYFSAENAICKDYFTGNYSNINFCTKMLLLALWKMIKH